jgi:two-component system, OmpR family, sensor histidine kinase KdpD
LIYGPGGVTIDIEAVPLSFLAVPHRVQRTAEVRALLLGLLALGLLTTSFVRLLHVANPAIVTLSFVLVVLVAATISTRRVAIAVSIGATFCFNYFFLEPIGTLRIADSQSLAELFTFLTVSVAASQLSSQVREAEVLRRSAELKSALLESLSHALRTPLTAVTVAANNLNSPTLSAGERREQADIVRGELNRLNRLFQDIVDMARIETRAVTVESEWVQPAELIEAATRLAGAACDTHVLNVDAGAERTLVRIDPRLTSAALGHVMENAGQYSPAGSAIDVNVTTDGGELQISTRDRGTGIAPPDQSRLFDRAYRGSGTDASHFGSGLGLTIARGLIAAEGGRINAANHPDGGAVVTIAIPVEIRVLDPVDGEPA